MNKFKKSDGFTSIELVTVIAVLAAIAYLVLPLVFPSDSKTPKQYIEEDLTNISEILQIRTQTSEVNGIPINEMYIGNLGVYASRAQVKHAIKINPQDKTLTFCLRGEYKDEVIYFESNAGILATPSGVMDCPGAPAQNSTGNGEDSPTEEAPAEEPSSEEPAPGN
jgi:type II secretory pathway pseudopilin PulG